MILDYFSYNFAGRIWIFTKAANVVGSCFDAIQPNNSGVPFSTSAVLQAELPQSLVWAQDSTNSNGELSPTKR